jgi:uncharacterized protein
MLDSLALQSLPLFPLGTVLCPDGSLPLRIFEVRYLDMIGKCYKTGAPFGVVTLKSGSEVRRADDSAVPDAFHPIGTLATITELSKPQAGLLVIRCTGAQRFRINSATQLIHGLWVGDVAPMTSDLAVAIPDDLQNVAVALRQLIQRLQNEAVPLADLPVQQPYRFDDCGWVANRWCELLPLPLAHKQALMALDNPLVRLELISDVLARTGIVT